MLSWFRFPFLPQHVHPLHTPSYYLRCFQARRDLLSFDTQQPYQHAIANAGAATEDPR